MNRLLFITLLLFSLNSTGQNLFPEKFNDCNTEMFFLEGREMYAKNDNEKLLTDIISKIDKEILKKLRGEIFLQVQIDTLGNPCCISLKQNLNTKVDPNYFKQIIDNHTGWTTPMKENEKTPVCAILKLTFLKKWIWIRRLGYNGKVGIVELSSYRIKKQKVPIRLSLPLREDGSIGKN